MLLKGFFVFHFQNFKNFWCRVLKCGPVWPLTGKSLYCWDCRYIPPCLAHFQNFIMYLGVNIFGFILFWFFSSSYIKKLVFSPNLESFKILFLQIPFPLSIWEFQYWIFVTAVQVPKTQFPFFSPQSENRKHSVFKLSKVYWFVFRFSLPNLWHPNSTTEYI
jgi:hypothetical protein